MQLPLSVLDLSPVGAGVMPSQAIRDSITLAQIADALAYRRYWFAEHHSMASIATSAPEILVAHAAAVTHRIRIGAGGIMVPNHVPLHVVEVFRTLASLYPGRIDLGLGRAPGTDPVTAAALRRLDGDANDQLAQLLAFEHGGFSASHPFSKIVPMPSDAPVRSIWMLGSTLAGAGIAARLGLPYAFAGHFAMRHAAPAIAHYRARFESSAAQPEPYVILAISVICAATVVDAERLAAPVRVAVVQHHIGRPAPICSVEDGLAYRFTSEERAIVDEAFTGTLIGTPEVIAGRLIALADESGANELMLAMLVPDVSARAFALREIMTAMESRSRDPDHRSLAASKSTADR